MEKLIRQFWKICWMNENWFLSMTFNFSRQPRSLFEIQKSNRFRYQVTINNSAEYFLFMPVLLEVLLEVSFIRNYKRKKFPNNINKARFKDCSKKSESLFKLLFRPYSQSSVCINIWSTWCHGTVRLCLDAVLYRQLELLEQNPTS